jgi:serine/threonine-protein kinase ULK/ATG1
VIKLNKLPIKIQNRIKIEVDILSKLSHPNIIKLYESFYHNGILYIVLEKCKSELHTILKNDYCDLSLETKNKWIIQLLSGLLYLHKNNIIHRDIKSQNILVSDDDNIKIIDFGFSKYFKIDKMMNTICGSPLFMSPELISGEKYNYKIDYWSMGLILYQIITGVLPYHAKNILELKEKLNNMSDILILDINKNDYDSNMIELVEKMLIINTNNRMDYNMFVNHKYIKKIFPKENFIQETFDFFK